MFGICVFHRCVLVHVLDLSSYKPGNTDFCFHGNLFTAALGIVAHLVAHIVEINLTITAHFAGCIIFEHIQRVLAGVETFLAQFGSGFLVGLADFVLEITAFHVFVKAFIHFHECFPPA